jgi:hypothetical protein
VPSGGGYQIAWKNGAADEYAVWNTDSSGNYLSATPVLSGANYALQSAETTFGQDLNGDGTVGPVVTTIEASGSTDLRQVADTYFTYAHGTTSGPQLNCPTRPSRWSIRRLDADRRCADGERGLVVWKNGAADQYIVWNLDGSGNYCRQVLCCPQRAPSCKSSNSASTRTSMASAGSRPGRSSIRRIDDAGCANTFVVFRPPARWVSSSNYPARRHGRPVRQLDADRRGAGGCDVSDRLEERRPDQYIG